MKSSILIVTIEHDIILIKKLLRKSAEVCLFSYCFCGSFLTTCELGRMNEDAVGLFKHVQPPWEIYRVILRYAENRVMALHHSDVVQLSNSYVSFLSFFSLSLSFSAVTTHYAGHTRTHCDTDAVHTLTIYPLSLSLSYIIDSLCSVRFLN